MRDWNLKTTDPLYLSLASDARLVPTDYCNDQIWELSLGGGEPSAIALQTTYGLRARSFRMFPVFTENDISISDPSDFIAAPQIKEFYPNFFSTQFSPFIEVDVQADYWVPHSHGVLIRLEFFNQSNLPRQIKLEWITQLAPNEGRNMSPVELDGTWVLSGNTANLAPVVLISGGAQLYTSPYPSFNQVLSLAPLEKRIIIISQAAFNTTRDSFTAARHFLGRSWDSEINRVRMENAGMIEIFTGDPDWDAAFAFSQNLLQQLRINPKIKLPFPSFVLSRHSDQGYSLRGDGMDYNHLWNGQPVLESYFLTCSLLPESAGFAKGLIRNFLSTQTQNGNIDWKPGVAGQLSQLLATPIFCTLTWRIFQFTSDKDFLKETYTSLYQFVKTWFSPQHDRDQDGIPEWDHIFQMGCEDHPVFSFIHPNSQGVDISTAESPALAAFLIRECQSLKEIGKILDTHEYDQELDSISEKLREFVCSAWNAKENSYLYRDKDTHLSTRGEKLAEQIGIGDIIIQRDFESPVRLLIHIQASDEKTRKVQLFIHGITIEGIEEVEHIAAPQTRWNQGKGKISSERLFKRVDSIVIRGIHASDLISVYTNNYHFHDPTSFIPLWAGIPSVDQAELMIKNIVSNPNDFFGSYESPTPQDNQPGHNYEQSQNINVLWLQLIGEGMLKYGYQNEVAQLFNQIMPSIIQSLKNTRSFREHYSDIISGGHGEKNFINGVAPISLFLDTIGIRLLSPTKIASRGFNPFPWPVTVKYRGLNIYKHKERSTIIFPNGETIEIEDATPKIISLDNSVG